MSQSVEETSTAQWIKLRNSGCQKTRNKIVLDNQGLVRLLASKFSGSEIPLEDLMQVGMIGLINAVDRYEPERGIKFSTYAAPTIIGEIKRHFRDKAWDIKVPRKLQKLFILCEKVSEKLSAKLERDPTPTELACEIQASEEDVLAALGLKDYYSLASLDQEIRKDSGGAGQPLKECIGLEDEKIAAIIEYDDVRTAIESLEPKLKFIIIRRFIHDQSQRSVGRDLNISQMQVSKLQHKALQEIRRSLKLKMATERPTAEPAVQKQEIKLMQRPPKEVEKMSDKQAVVIPMSVASLAFWIYAINQDGESNQIDFKKLSKQIGIVHNRVHTKTELVLKMGVIKKGAGKAIYIREKGVITISKNSKIPTVEVLPGLIFERGKTYDLAILTNKALEQEEVRAIAEGMKVKTRNVNGSIKRLKRSKTPPDTERIAETIVSAEATPPQVVSKIKALGKIINSLAGDNCFDPTLIGHLLNSHARHQLRSWLDIADGKPASKEPLSKSQATQEAPKDEVLPSVSDPNLDKCLETILRICNDSCKHVVQIYLAGK